jgi:predicted O-linked N-acetylglucosamine transferase (SPINDLY family)
LKTTDVETLLASGKAREALALASQGAAQNPADAQWLHVLGATMHACGQSADAVAQLRKATSLDPGNSFAWNTLGGVLLSMGNSVQAESALREALRIDPASDVARFNLAIVQKNRGDYAGARENLAQILAQRPDDSTRFEMAMVLMAEGDYAGALSQFDELLKKHPDQPQLLSHHAFALASIGRVDEAAAQARQAIAAAPQSPDIHSIAAGALAQAGFAGEAQRVFAAIAAYRPQVPAAWQRLGFAAVAAGDTNAALEAFGRQVALAPRNRAALASLGTTLMAAERYEDAIKIFGQSADVGHRDASTLAALVHAKGLACDWSGLDSLERELRDVASEPSATPAMPQCAVYFDTTPAEQLAWAGNWARSEFTTAAKTFESPGPRDGRRIRLGYLSGDFLDHATSYLMAGLLEHHDRDRFEVFAYSAGRNDESAARKRVAGAVDHFVDLQGMHTWAAARRIAQDRLDVLLDLGGYVRNSHMGVMALRPAPVQGHFLGYPGTTGAPFIDFFVGDAFTIPAGGEAGFSERVLRMPACYQPNDPARSNVPAKPRAAFGLSGDAIVLCSFNQGVKIRPATFAKWCKLLEALPAAILWLPTNGAGADARLREAARGHGVDPKRVVLAPRLPHEEHLARLKCADIAIDTFPCTSHTTASDALGSGVPLVTTYGETFASRVAASVLRAAGCGEWAFADADRAFDATLALARDRDARVKAREKLAATIRTSALFDMAAFARDFEARIAEALEPRS